MYYSFGITFLLSYDLPWWWSKLRSRPKRGSVQAWFPPAG